MANNNEVTISPQPDPTFLLDNKRLDLEAGTLGRFFGIGSGAPTNIAGLTVLLLMVAGIGLMFFDTKMPAQEYWKVAAPIITLALGYLFGRKD
jgi:hypothetical protein